MEKSIINNIFFNGDFTDATSKEVDAAKKSFTELLNKTAAEMKIDKSVLNKLGDAVDGLNMENQFLGFTQGFNTAIELLMGNGGTAKLSEKVKSSLSQNSDELKKLLSASINAVGQINSLAKVADYYSSGNSTLDTYQLSNIEEIFALIADSTNKAYEDLITIEDMVSSI